MVAHQSKPINENMRAEMKPPKMNQRILPRIFIVTS